MEISFHSGRLEGTEHVKPQTYKEYRGKTAKNAATVREEKTNSMEKNRRVNQNIEVVIMDKDDSKKKSKLKKALKIAGGVGALGVLGAGTAIAGDALNLWDLGEVGGVTGKVLSPLDKAGNALNKMALSKQIKFDKHNLELKDSFNKVMNDPRYRLEMFPYGVPFDPEGHPFKKMIESAYFD